MSELSKTDMQILDLLQKDGRMTNVALAEQIKMSPSPCLRRVKQLEASGHLKQYVAIVDRLKAGFGIMAFAEVKIPQVAGRSIMDEFKAAVRLEPSITACYMTAGNFDVIMRILVKDMEAYARLVQDVLLKLPGVQDLRSNFVLEEIKETTELPMDYN
jgi:Lrp/AsnC family leucine-responsive transcriptional regulator